MKSIFLSICLIVKNEAESLGLTLKKIKPFTDEIVVVDTGSEDSSVQIAKNAGARVFYFPWKNDFSAARNFSLGKARGRWILVLDADEFMEEENLKKLPELLKNSRADVFYCPILATDKSSFSLPPKKRTVFSCYHIYRLFRNLPKIKFWGRVHESIYPAISFHNLKIGKLPFAIWHFGYDPAGENYFSKVVRNLTYLLEEAREFPERADTLFELGRTYSFFAGAKDEAIFYLEKAIKNRALELTLSRVGIPFFSRGTSLYYMHLFLAEVYLDKKEFPRALVELAKATIFREHKSEIEPLFLMGLAHKELGNLKLARTAFEIVEKLAQPINLNNLPDYPSRPHLVYSTLVELAEILIEEKQFEKAQEKIERIKHLNYPLPEKLKRKIQKIGKKLPT